MQRVPTLVAHARTRPRRNAFHYKLCYFAIPVSEWVEGTRGVFFSVDRFNLFSIRSEDYGDGTASPGKWIAGILGAQGLSEADGEIVLLTLPRLLGYAFNPVSFWFCFDRTKQLRAVLAEGETILENTEVPVPLEDAIVLGFLVAGALEHPAEAIADLLDALFALELHFEVAVLPRR